MRSSRRPSPLNDYYELANRLQSANLLSAEAALCQSKKARHAHIDPARNATLFAGAQLLQGVSGMFDLNKRWKGFVDRRQVIAIAFFLTIVVVPFWFLLGVNDWIKGFFQSYTTTSVVTDRFELSGICRQNYSLIGIKVTGQIQLTAWTHRLNGKAVGTPSPSYSVRERIRQDGERFLLLGADGATLKEVSAGEIDYIAPDTISLNLGARNGHKPELSAGKLTIGASGDFDAGHEVSMVCDLELEKIL